MKLQAESFIRLPPYVDFRAPADAEALEEQYRRIESVELEGDRIIRHQPEQEAAA